MDDFTRRIVEGRRLAIWVFVGNFLLMLGLGTMADRGWVSRATALAIAPIFIAIMGVSGIAARYLGNIRIVTPRGENSGIRDVRRATVVTILGLAGALLLFIVHLLSGSH